MFRNLFALAMRSPGRQLAFRRALAAHLLLLLATGGAVQRWDAIDPRYLILFGQILLVAGIVEGAILIGWRLTQMPKNQSLEFLLVTPVRPHGVLLAEAAVGLGRLALVTLSGLPLFIFLLANRRIELIDIPVLLIMPLTWGAITGLGLTMWAYEPLGIRRIGERVIFVGILLYLGVGILIGERLPDFLKWLPGWTIGDWQLEPSRWILFSFHAFHELNPFGVMQSWMEADYLRRTLTGVMITPAMVDARMRGLEIAAVTMIGLLLLRTAARLKGHFHERHYKPAIDPRAGNRGMIGDRPLAWWAVRRVTEYAGKANIWLAWGISLIYAAYTVAGPYWPDWLGKIVFVIFDRHMGGIPALSTALVVLASVPAAWQYGLWDSNVQDRVKRLELLLLTELGPRDYWEAATAAAWNRGRGYFAAAAILWLALLISGKATPVQIAGAAATAVLLWSFSFALGFRAFSRGIHANGIGSLLTLGIPALTYGLYMADWPALAALLPPGSIYASLRQPESWIWLISPLIIGPAALVVSRFALAQCDSELRRWYDENHGKRTAD